MAFYKQDIVDINLNTGNIYRSFLNHAIGYKNDDADRFGIRTFRDGEPVDLTGVSCQAVFMSPNGSNIALTSYGTVSGNVAYVTLPPACYDYEGQFCLSIQLVGGGVTGTMRIVDGMVVNTGASGTVAPTSSVPTYQEIIAQYDAMVAATAAANGAIAATYSGSATYKVGDYCIHDGGLYRCTTAITTAEAWNAAHWTATKIGPDVSDLKSAINVMSGIDFPTLAQGNVTGSVGSSVNVNLESNNYKYTVIDAIPGWGYLVSHKCRSSKSIYVYFVDGDGVVLSDGESYSVSDGTIETEFNIAPDETSKMYVCSYAPNGEGFVDIKASYNLVEQYKKVEEMDIKQDEFEPSTEYVNRFCFNLGVTPETSIKGITYAIDEDGVLTIDGTPTDKIYFNIMGGNRSSNVKNLVSGKPIMLQRELISGTENGNPVFRITYDYSSSQDGASVTTGIPFVPTSDGCLFIRINTGTSFTNAKYKFMVTDGVLKYPIIPRQKTANDFYLREKIELEEKSKAIFDSAIQSKNRMLFSAHRGAEGQAPYGSYPSYKLACEQGWDMIQIAQARQSKDGTWYCIHDASVDEQTNGTGNIADLTDEYIGSIYQDVGVNIDQYTEEELRLPTLESVLQLAYRYGVMVSIRMGSLPNDYRDSAWTSFINLVSKYRPERMMFSGTLDQVIALKALTHNWHGQVYITTDTVSTMFATLLQYGYTNMSILASKSYVSDSLIESIHEAGYYYVSTQTGSASIETFTGYSDSGVDVAQTGISSIHSLIT